MGLQFKVSNNQGKQVIITSDRLLFNAREDFLTSSDKNIIFTTNGDFHINSDNVNNGKVAINAPKIHLGKISDAKPGLADNPALKGKETAELIEDLLNHLDMLYSTVLPLLTNITIFPGLPTAPNPTNIALILPLQSELRTIRGKLNSIKSKNVYIK